MDIALALRKALEGDAREPDNKLHASSHLTSPLRHVQLEMAGAPQRPRTFADEITLMTGTLWHSYMNKVLFDLRTPVMMEVKLDEWMPDGWSGTADYFIWNKEHKAYQLRDLKTIRGAGLSWILYEGAKEAHQWQLTSYWIAAKNMGLPLMDEYEILYLPKDAVPGKDVQPTAVSCKPLDEALVLAVMAQRKADVDAYLNGYGTGDADVELAPIPDRELKRSWNAKAKVFDITLKPHWSSMYCRFEDCGCSEQGQTKQGHWSLEDGLVVWNGRDCCEDVSSDAFIRLIPAAKEFR